VIKAMTLLPEVLSELKEFERPEGRYEVGASDLTEMISGRGVSSAAAEWAIHRFVQERLLTAHQRSYSRMLPDEIAGDPNKRVWFPLPETGSVPFAEFTVRATLSLWEKWRLTQSGRLSPSGEPLSNKDDASVQANGDGKTRPAFERDHLFLKWHEEGLKPAEIRVRWNKENPKKPVKQPVVKQALKRAKGEKSKA
jgi:hypothetical protein